jgi:hypothetical protein
VERGAERVCKLEKRVYNVITILLRRERVMETKAFFRRRDQIGRARRMRHKFPIEARPDVYPTIKILSELLKEVRSELKTVDVDRSAPGGRVEFRRERVGPSSNEMRRI